MTLDVTIQCECKLTMKYKESCTIRANSFERIINSCEREKERDYSITERIRLSNNSLPHTSDGSEGYCNALDYINWSLNYVDWSSYQHQRQRNELSKDIIMQMLQKLK